MSSRFYRRSEHGFFDEVVVMFASFAALRPAIVSEREGTAKGFGPYEAIDLQGSEQSRVKWRYLAKPILQAIAQDEWPEEIEIREEPLHVASGTFTLKGLQGLITSIAEAAFLRYFESNKPTIEAAHSSDPNGWPPVWNFARLVRNAFAHGGFLDIRNPSAAPLSWRGITYGPGDNGNQILFSDFTPVEMLMLMEEMDGEL